MSIFVSYAHVDLVVVAQLADVLRVANLDAWWDDKLEVGDDWKGELRSRIGRCDAFLCVVSPDAVESEWCQWELAQAASLRKPIVPILVRSGCQIPASLASLQHLDMSQGLDVPNVARLVAKLSRLGQVAAVSTSTPSQPQGFPARFRQPLPKRYRTIAQGYLQPRFPGMNEYKWPTQASAIKKSSPIVGIDFGTTTSAIAIHRTSGVELIPNDLGYVTTPSAVAISETGMPLVGQRALDQLLRHPSRGVLETKRLFGEEMHREFRGEPVLEIDGITYTPVDLAAFVFDQLRRDAEAHLDGAVSKAILTIPAYFDPMQCAAVVEAARRARLEAVRIIAEPVAACLARRSAAGPVLVYDLGGGTFDVSVLNPAEGSVEVMAVHGDTVLGGADFDRLTVDYCLQEFRNETGADLSGDAVALMRVRDAAERAKISLSAVRHVTVDVPHVSFVNGLPLHLSVPISQTRYNEITHELVARTITLTQLVLADAGLSVEDLKEVLIVGRASRAVSVRTALADLFSCPVRFAPDEAVATGAGVYAGVLAGTERDVLLLDSVTHTLRAEIAGGGTLPLLPRHTIIPTRKTFLLKLPPQSKRTVTLRLLSGEHYRANENLLLCESDLTVPAGQEEFQIVIGVDANSLVTVGLEPGGTVASVDLRKGRVGPAEVRRTLDKDQLLPFPVEVLKLPAFHLSDSGDVAKVTEWLISAVVDTDFPSRTEAQAAAHREVVRRDPLSGLSREYLVDALEDRFHCDLSGLRYMTSIEAIAAQFVRISSRRSY